MDEIAIKVNGIQKLYKLYNKPSDRLVESLGLSKKKRYIEHFALHDISFEVKKGETVGLIGTNGSGKSTMLKIITGVLSPTFGSVDIHGRISALLELGAGFNMEYTGIENVYLNGTMIGFTKEEIDARLGAILEFADIGDFVHQPVKTYSSGMFVRLAFAVAINIDPEILIVDEALSVGDVFFQAKCYRKFEEFKQMGKTILFVSHDLGSIHKYCDRAILLNKGRKTAEGAPAKIIDLYKKVLSGYDDNKLVLEDEEDDGDQGQVKDLEETDHKNYIGDQECAEGSGHVKGPEDAGNNTGKWRECYDVNPDTQEYGDRYVEIFDFAVIDSDGAYTGTLLKGKECKIKVKIRAAKEVDSPIVAFTIRDLKGTEITGTNTLFEKTDVGRMHLGEIRTITFSQKMDMQGGQYLLSLGCTRYEENRFQVYHRLYDVCGISVVSDKNTVGFYDMNSAVTVE